MAQGISFTGDVQAVSATLCATGYAITGISFLDTSTSANTVAVYDGTSTSGKLIAAATVAGSGGTDIDFGSPRVATGGIYVDTTGACKGTVWVA